MSGLDTLAGGHKPERDLPSCLSVTYDDCRRNPSPPGSGDSMKSQYEGQGSDLAAQAHVPARGFRSGGPSHLHEGPPEASAGSC